MSWQDRDYARGPDPRQWSSRPTGWGGGAAGGRSIVTTLIVANVAVHVLWGFLLRDSAIWFFKIGALQTGRVLHGEVWRLFTYQYLHADGNHILFNMIGLYFLGRALERVWAPKKFLVIYTLAGLIAGLFYMLLNLIGWLPPGEMVGASGCILGLLGACAVLFPHAEVYVYFLFPVRIRTAAVVFAAIYFLNVWRKGFNAGGDAAHLAGLAFGAWYAWAGERWWRLKGSALFSGRGRASAPGGRGQPSSWQAGVERRKADAELIDRLLAKVYEGGIHCLTPAERKALTEATERQRQAEERVGRTDRL